MKPTYTTSIKQWPIIMLERGGGFRWWQECHGYTRCKSGRKLLHSCASLPTWRGWRRTRAKGHPLVTKRPVNKHGVRLCSSRILTISDTLFVIYELTGTPMAPHLSFRLSYDVLSTCVVFLSHHGQVMCCAFSFVHYVVVLGPRVLKAITCILSAFSQLIGKRR